MIQGGGGGGRQGKPTLPLFRTLQPLVLGTWGVFGVVFLILQQPSMFKDAYTWMPVPVWTLSRSLCDRTYSYHGLTDTQRTQRTLRPLYIPTMMLISILMLIPRCCLMMMLILLESCTHKLWKLLVIHVWHRRTQQHNNPPPPRGVIRQEVYEAGGVKKFPAPKAFTNGWCLFSRPGNEVVDAVPMVCAEGPHFILQCLWDLRDPDASHLSSKFDIVNHDTACKLVEISVKKGL